MLLLQLVMIDHLLGVLYFKILSNIFNITIEETITNDRFVTVDEEEAISYIRGKIVNLVHPED